MREHLKNHIDLLFRGAENADDIKQEILQNTLDRYDDLIAQGKSPEAAFQLAISGIGDISELLNAKPSVTAPAAPQRESTEKPLWKRILIAIAIFLYIVAAIPLVVLSSMNMSLIGLTGTLAIVAVATPLLIIASSGPSETVKDEKRPVSKLDSIVWLVGTVVYLLLSFATGAWFITWIIFCILPCLSAIERTARNIGAGRTSAIIKIALWSLLILILVGILIAGLNGDGISVGFSEFDGLPGGTEASSGEVDAKTVKNIDIRWVSGKIILRRDDSAQTISFREDASAGAPSMAYLINGNSLTIAFMKNAEWAFGITKTPSDKTLVVTVPAFWGHDELKITAVSADVDMTGILGEELDLITVSGDVTISGSFNDVEIETVSGDLDFIGPFKTFSAETVSGDHEITTPVTPQKIEFESVSGHLKLKLPESMGFDLIHDSVSGDLHTTIPITSTNGRKTYGNGECSIKIDTVSGEVYIDHNK